MSINEITKVPTKYLPKNWRQLGADRFGCSKAKIEKVVWAQIKDVEIFDYMLGLAEKGKRDFEAKQQSIQDRLKTITS